MCCAAATLAPRLSDANDARALGVLLTGLARCLRPRPPRSAGAQRRGSGASEIQRRDGVDGAGPDLRAAGTASAAGAAGATAEAAVAAAAAGAPATEASAVGEAGAAASSAGQTIDASESCDAVCHSCAPHMFQLQWEGLDAPAAAALGSAVGALLVTSTRQASQRQPPATTPGTQALSSAIHPPSICSHLPNDAPRLSDQSSLDGAQRANAESRPASAPRLNARSLTMLLWGAARLRLPLTARQKEAALAATRQLLLGPSNPRGAGTSRLHPPFATPGARNTGSGSQAAAAWMGDTPGGQTFGSSRGGTSTVQLVVCCWALHRLGCRPGARWRQDVELAAERRLSELMGAPSLHHTFSTTMQAWQQEAKAAEGDAA